VLTSIERQLTAHTIDQYADLSQRNSPELLFDLMGFGRLAGPFEQFRADHLRSSFGPSRDDDRGGTLAAGSVAAQRITISGIRASPPML
jgi:hypothetical protein